MHYYTQPTLVEYNTFTCALGLDDEFLSTTPANIDGDTIRGKCGQVIALWQMVGDTGMIVGSETVKFTSDSFSFCSPFDITAEVFTVSVLLAFRLSETKKSHLDPPNHLRTLVIRDPKKV